MLRKKILQIKAFTLVEIMVVIAIIGILSTLIMVSLDNTKMTARNTRRLADIKQLQLALKLYYNDVGSFPVSITPGSPIAANGVSYLLRVPANPKPRADNGCLDQEYTYTQLEGGKRYMLSFCLGDTTDDLSKGTHLATSNGILDCPTDYIPVPGSATFETSDFCVMKYEAKCADIASPTVGLTSPLTSSKTYDDYYHVSANPTGVPCTAANSKVVISASGGNPIGNISQQDAKLRCQESGGHLITNAEWMTIARNIEQVPINWSGLAVGSGEISRGHYNGILFAIEGYSEFGTGDSTHAFKRDLTLLSGDTIKDFSGNVAEWVDTLCTPGDGQGKYYDNSGAVSTFDWDDSAKFDDYERAASGPSISTWTFAQGIGQYTECAAPLNEKNAFLRGGGSDDVAAAGIFSLNLRRSIYTQHNTDTSQYLYGFRCVK
jgi:prepilin-type N-terminal cleavage/methylation domain-containing protein